MRAAPTLAYEDLYEVVQTVTSDTYSHTLVCRVTQTILRKDESPFAYCKIGPCVLTRKSTEESV